MANKQQSCLDIDMPRAKDTVASRRQVVPNGLTVRHGGSTSKILKSRTKPLSN